MKSICMHMFWNLNLKCDLTHTHAANVVLIFCFVCVSFNHTNARNHVAIDSLIQQLLGVCIICIVALCFSYREKTHNTNMQVNIKVVKLKHFPVLNFQSSYKNMFWSFFCEGVSSTYLLPATPWLHT